MSANVLLPSATLLLLLQNTPITDDSGDGGCDHFGNFGICTIQLSFFLHRHFAAKSLQKQK